MNYKEVQDETKRKFQELDFTQGDFFHEQYAFYYFVASVKGEDLIVFEGHPSSGHVKIHYWTREEFTDKCAYKYGNGYWIDFWTNRPGLIPNYFESLDTYHPSKREVKLVKFAINYEEV